MTHPARTFTSADQAKYQINKAIVVKHRETARGWATALMTIRTTELYLLEFPTWDQWCEAYVPWSAATLKKVFAEEAKQLHHHIGEKDEPAHSSAQPVDNSKGEGVPAKAKGKSLVDETGFPIPEHLHEIWERRDTMRPTLLDLSNLRRKIEEGRKSLDPVIMKIDQSVIEDIKAAYHCISRGRFFCVCGTCNGWYEKVSDGVCKSCNSTGFMSKDQYDRLLPEQIKAIRERSTAKKK